MHNKCLHKQSEQIYLLNILEHKKSCSALQDSLVAKNLGVIPSFILAASTLYKKVLSFCMFFSILLKN